LRVITTVALAAATALTGVMTLAAGAGFAAAAPAITRAAAPRHEVLDSISCQTSRDCLAIGADDSAVPLAQTWNGTAWHAAGVRLPAGSTDVAFDAVAATGTPGTFVAVGSYIRKNPYGFFNAFADEWNGNAWTPAEPPGGGDSRLNAVSCSSPDHCLAIGSFSDPEGGKVGELADSRNGSTWTSLNPAIALGGPGSALNAVSCAAGPFCVAVGPTFAGKTLIFSWNGRVWTALKPAPVKGVSKLSLDGVSCASAGSCVAVGNGGGEPGDVAEVWNGASWAATGPIAWPKGATNPRVTGVSCANASYCLAVGIIDRNPKTGASGRAAASLWNGKSWTATTVAAPGENRISAFDGVTCLRPAFCAAVGQAGPSDLASSVGLSGFWNGKSWRLVVA
jgi:hypothetical protein